MSKPFSFKIGADPEFTIMCGIRVADASRTIPILVKNNPDCKSESMGFTVKKHGNIGWDGAAATGELRPSPSNVPKEVCDNIYNLFASTTKEINIFKMTTLSTRQSIGGHIHLELQEAHKDSEKDKKKIAEALSSFYLPLMLGDNFASLNLRWSKSSNYGDLSDYRCENGKTIEYRCPSAEWLTTPKVAEATLAYFGVIYNEIIKDPAAFCKKYKDVMIKSKDQSHGIQTLILSNSADMIKNLFDKLLRYVKTFEMYKDYKKEIDFITNPKEVIAEKKKYDFDIIAGWGLKGKAPTRRELTNQKRLDIKTKELNLEAISDLVPVQHNGDLNTEVFANEIKKRIIALNWSPKNKYFIFGLRQGVKDYLIFNKAGQMYTGKKLINTVEDAEFINQLFSRMDSKFSCEGRGKSDLEKYVIIGVPYDRRQTINTKEFIKYILDIESGTLKGEKLRRAEVVQTSAKNAKSNFTSEDSLYTERIGSEFLESEDDAIMRMRERENLVRQSAETEDLDEDIDIDIDIDEDLDPDPEQDEDENN